MKTPNEIKNALKQCSYDKINRYKPCSTGCPYFKDLLCPSYMLSDALALIQQLEAERDQYKRERDAAVADIKQIIQDPFGVSCCDFCKFGDNEEECEKRNCRGNRADFEWRGAEVEG